MTRYVRVGTNNNFNCTRREWDQLNRFSAEYPNDVFFVNCNAKTPLLRTINSHPYNAVITINPDLIPNDNLTSKVMRLGHQRVSFIRVKWLPERPDIQNLIHSLRKSGFEVVITAQRFNSIRSLELYTSKVHYNYSCSRYRLANDSWNELVSLARKTKSMICDEKELGCQGCSLCSTLNGGTKNDQVVSLNLSTSGICPYNCVDCYAKTMQHFLTAIGNDPIKYDRIKANNKQRGATKHIKHAKAA